MIWKKIKDYEESYEVSDTGEVRSIDRLVELPNGKSRFAKGRTLKLGINNRGYIDVQLNSKGVAKTHLVHRLVATAFIPNEQALPFVNHISGDKTQNHYLNLEWTNATENTLHAYRMGLNRNCGHRHNFAVSVIDTKTGDLFCTIKDFCRYYGKNYNSGKNALNGYQNFPANIDLENHSFSKYTC